jgi:fibronectin type 3 domain-containing protein
VVAFPTEEGIRLTWRGGEGKEISGYRVYRSETSEGPWMLLTEPPVTTILFDDRGAERGQWYWYGVTALDEATPPNESEMSDPVKAGLR